MSQVTVSPINRVITIGQGTGAVLSPNPSGTFTAATVTVDSYGRVTSAQNTANIANAATQAQIQATVDAIYTAVSSGGIFGGQWT